MVKAKSFYLTTCRIYGLLKYFSRIELKILDTNVLKILSLLPSIESIDNYTAAIEMHLFKYINIDNSVTSLNEINEINIEAVFYESQSNIISLTDRQELNFKWIFLDNNIDIAIKKKLLNILFTYRPGVNKNIHVKNKSLLYFREDNVAAEAEVDGLVYLLSLIKLWNIINYFYPYKILLDNSWDNVFEMHYHRLLNTCDKAHYRNTLSLLMTALKDSHIFLKDGTIKKALFRIPIRFKYLDSKLLISKIYDSTENLNIGDEVLQIDHRTVSDMYTEFATIRSHSNEHACQARFANYVWQQYTQNTSISIVLKRNDVIHKVQLQALTVSDWNENILPLLQKEAPTKSKIINNTIGYLYLESITYFEFYKHYNKIKDCRHLILDCRGYGTLAIFKLLRRLNRHAQKVTQFYYPIANMPGTFRKSKSENFFTRNDIEVFARMILGMPSISKSIHCTKTYAGQVYVLLDAKVISFGETQLMAIRKYRRDAIFIGQPTTGANGNVCSATLPGDIVVYWSGIDYQYADGEQVQQKGIQPDIFIELSIDDIHRDLILEKTIEIIESKKKY